jgi:hypothetical protein
VWTFMVRSRDEGPMAAWAVRGATPFLLRWVPRVCFHSGGWQVAHRV